MAPQKVKVDEDGFRKMVLRLMDDPEIKSKVASIAHDTFQQCDDDIKATNVTSSRLRSRTIRARDPSTEGIRLR